MIPRFIIPHITESTHALQGRITLLKFKEIFSKQSLDLKLIIYIFKYLNSVSLHNNSASSDEL